MATINKKRPAKTIKTHEGAIAKRIPAEAQLERSVMSCFLWEKEFYESGVLIADRIRDLVSKCDGQFVAGLAIKARQEMNLRHVPLLLIREMARNPAQRPYVAAAFTTVISRADEITEFMALYWQDKRQPLASCVKKGLAGAFLKFNEYALAKYNREGAIKLRDVLFLCHAKPDTIERDLLWKKLILDKLAIPDTWETRLSAGKDKKESFTELMAENKLGALALLRNLRNMETAKVEHDHIKSALVKADVSKVLPFRFIAAARYAPWLEPDLEKALFRNTAALPKLEGKTTILVDVSGSMDDQLSGKSDMKRIDAACGLAMILRQICENIRVYTFSNQLVEVAARQGFALRDLIIGSQAHGGTALGAALLNTPPGDRLIVITDEQTRDNIIQPKGFKGYMINVASAKNGVGYGKWIHLDGFSESIVRYIVEYENTDNIDADR